MAEPALDRLAVLLLVDPGCLAFLERLGEPAVDGFAALVDAARARDEKAVEDGLQQTLRFVPRLLRGRAKKLLFPEDER